MNLNLRDPDKEFIFAKKTQKLEKAEIELIRELGIKETKKDTS